jgi:small subunit ribosomal protein S17
MTEAGSVTKTLVGKVISDKMDKTIIVQIERLVKHPLYGKYVKRFSKIYAHDALGKSKLGDKVEIKQGRPISKKKNWVLVQVIA